MRIIWSTDAENDLLLIHSFYAKKDKKVVIHLYNFIVKEADILLSFPEIAPIEPMIYGHEFTFRSLVVASGKFKLIYFRDNEVIFISHVWDCRQNPENIRQY